MTKRFLEDNGLQLLVRSHEVKEEGYEVAHDGYCITVFSAPNYCDQMGNKVGGCGEGPGAVRWSWGREWEVVTSDQGLRGPYWGRGRGVLCCGGNQVLRRREHGELHLQSSVGKGCSAKSK